MPRPQAKKSPTRSRAPKRATKHSTPLLDKSDLQMILHDLANQIAPADVAQMMTHEKALRAETERIAGPHLSLLRNQLRLALDCLRDHGSGACPQIPYVTIALLAAGVHYFSDALDVIPDFLPRIGRLDDAAVMAMAYKLAADGVRRYCAWKGRPAESVMV